MHVIIIGAGPAGLTAAYLLAKKNVRVTVIEADPNYVGGIAKTVQYKGYCFDIGGHRFFSKSKEIEALWNEILPNDMLERPRLSRIFYQKKFFAYPLKIFDVLTKLGWTESFYCFLSYLKARLYPISNPNNFSEWVTNHFGKRLFSIFFKTYTEKVWGMPCEKISADWAAQRIKGLSFLSALKNAMPFRKKSSAIKTLIHSFRYPRKGPGMLWEACAEKIKAHGGEIMMNHAVTQCEWNANTQTWRVSCNTSRIFTGTHIISSAPLRELMCDYIQPVSSRARDAASHLKYRDFLIVVLILKDKHHLTDNWIYIHDPSVDVARIQNFKSWSPDMVPDPTMCCYGMEYFCFEGDGLWDKTDADLIQKAKREIAQIGLAKAEDVIDGCVVRQLKAYPVYDAHYKEHVDVIRDEIEKHYPTLHVVGRNGMHKYNNQDHAMMTAMLTVNNLLAGNQALNIWNVNQDAEYIESGSLRLVPQLAEK